MKKKLLAIVSAAVLLLTACGGNDELVIGAGDANTNTASEVSEAENAEVSGEEITAAKGYTFIYNGVEISIDAKMEDLLAKLGTEDSYFEAPSCAFDGMQKIYTYGSMELNTYIGEDGDYLDAIILKDDLISTPEGIRVGDTPEMVVEAYGENYTDNNGSYTYEKDDMKLNFIVEDGAVVSIQYKSNAVG